MADPVSWLLIEPGWRVERADGTEIGRVLEVTGDSTHDIFDGLAISDSALGTPKYVPAENVAGIVEGSVRLSLDEAGVAALVAYSEPAEVEEIEPEKAPLGRRLETDVAPPDHRGQIGLIRRVLLWLGLAGRR
jgi:hypothetical protein